jgi:adenylate kinase
MSQPFGLRVCLIGLPGAGKTTLAAGLSGPLRASVFSSGTALRRLAREDERLAHTLAQGALGPEDLVLRAVARAHADAGAASLLLDGFPRHATQVKAADDILLKWVPVLVDVDPSVAIPRLAGRLSCDTCGLAAREMIMPGTCPRCGGTAWSRRKEDTDSSGRDRVNSFAASMSALDSALAAKQPIRINGNQRPEEVLEATLTALALDRH